MAFFPTLKVGFLFLRKNDISGFNSGQNSILMFLNPVIMSLAVAHGLFVMQYNVKKENYFKKHSF